VNKVATSALRLINVTVELRHLRQNDSYISVAFCVFQLEKLFTTGITTGKWLN